MDVFSNDRGIYVFGPFRLDPTRRMLWRDDAEIKLTGRPFETLLYLLQNADRLVEKDEIRSVVWPGRIVEEATLTQTISSVRKSLQPDGQGPAIITTVAGRGYRITIPVGRDSAPIENADLDEPARPAKSLALNLAMMSLALTILVAGAGFWVWTHGAGHTETSVNAPPPFAPPPISVAVLPFANIGGTASRDYLSDGLSEEVIGSLAQIDQIRVAARTSSFSFRKSTAQIPEIARKLNVATVLEGSIRWDGAHMRITAQLIDGQNGFQRWSHTYDRDQGDMLHLETDIATAISKELKITILATDIARLNALGTDNPQALDAYLRGNMLKRKLDPQTTKLALAAFDEAVALDPKFVMAHVLRARVLSNMQEGFSTASTDVAALQRVGDQAVAESELAVSLAPDFGPAHDVLAVTSQDRWDFVRAGAEFTRARDLSPNDAAVLQHYVWFEAMSGHALTVLDEAKRVTSLDPLSPKAYMNLFWYLMWVHQTDEAETTLRHAEELGLNARFVHFLKGRLALEKGDAKAASQDCAGGEDWTLNFCLAIADHMLGKQAEADQALAKLRALVGDTAAFQFADVYAQWGRTNDALDWLEKAYHLHDPGLVQLKVDPLMDPIRAEPRFKEIERNMNFPA